jgi:hypothetical protein
MPYLWHVLSQPVGIYFGLPINSHKPRVGFARSANAAGIFLNNICFAFCPYRKNIGRNFQSTHQHLFSIRKVVVFDEGFDTS